MASAKPPPKGPPPKDPDEANALTLRLLGTEELLSIDMSNLAPMPATRELFAVCSPEGFVQVAPTTQGPVMLVFYQRESAELMSGSRRVCRFVLDEEQRAAGPVTRQQAWDRSEKYDGKPHAWLQWKGTEVCADIRCKCGHQSHFDGGFMYNVRCPECRTVYFVNGHVQLIEIDPSTAECIQEAE